MPEHDVVDAESVVGAAEGGQREISAGGHPDIGLEVIAGFFLVERPSRPAGAAVGVVQTLNEEGERLAGMADDDLQAGELIENAAEDQPGHRGGHVYGEAETRGGQRRP